VLAAGGIGIAFSVWNGLQLRGYRRMQIRDVPARELADGTYRGRASCGIDYIVDVTVRDGRLEAIEPVERRASRYARLAEAVLPRIVAAQTPGVDAITGATTSSKCLMRATESALSGGGLAARR
jgi:uncharacterized protein with FMN-binding domain